MTRIRQSQIWIEAAVFVLLGLSFFSIAIPPAWRTLNTDFPNYYLTARLVREGVDTSRAYEWIWTEREKDHRDLDQRIVGLVPITPFSTLIVLPLAKLTPLTAKRIWIIFNLALMVATAFVLARVSGLSLMQTGILLELSHPLQRNLLFGQYYVLLLAILTLACWAAQRRHRVLTGALVGFAAALKIYPILLVLYFLRKKDWRALVSCVLTVAAATCVSIGVFGVSMHRTYLQQVLPWTLRGECLSPFNLGSSSLSTVLHRLFVYEPQWNPHPAIHAAWLLVVLHPILQLILLAPAVLLIDCKDIRPMRVALEWAGLLVVALTISTLPASYQFTVLLLPVAVLCGHLVRTRSYVLLSFAVVCFLAIGYSGWHIQPQEGWGTLLCVPRLYMLIALSSLVLYLPAKKKAAASPTVQALWIAGLAALTLTSIFSGLRRQQGLFDDYSYRVPMASDILLAAHPVAYGNHNIAFIALTGEGYRATSISALPVGTINMPATSATDQLSLAVAGNQIWTEEVLSRSILRSATQTAPAIDNAESPTLSFDGHTIAFLRQIKGHKQLFLRDLLQTGSPERQLTSSWNVEEVAFLPDTSLVFAAEGTASKPTLYLLSLSGEIASLPVGEARYPAISPDGHWLAFSGFIAGNWNLYLRDMESGATKRLTRAPCNQLEPAWQADSKTLLYATDCGRALWFTALARRRVIP